MSKKLVYILVGVLSVYILIHWYTILRLWQFLEPLFPSGKSLFYLFFLVLALLYPAGRLANHYLPGQIGDRMIVAGSYWLGALFYAFLAVVLIDGVYSLDKQLCLLPGCVKPDQPAAGLLVVVLSLSAVLLGVRNARDVQIRRFTLRVDKSCKLDSLTIVCVSDLHLGLLVGIDRLRQLIGQITKLKPDLVVFPGDIIDETVGVFADSGMVHEFLRLTPRLGVFGCLGNHEYIWGSAEKALQQLTAAGIRILRDEYEVVADSFIIAGRDDVVLRRFSAPRQDLASVLQGADRSLPIILLDHTPSDLRVGPQCGVDLQLLGHTHRGQMFPFNFFTREAFKVDWGYTKQNQCHTIVSSGFGTWGPPLRIGSKPEILYIELIFSPKV